MYKLTQRGLMYSLNVIHAFAKVSFMNVGEMQQGLRSTFNELSSQEVQDIQNSDKKKGGIVNMFGHALGYLSETWSGTDAAQHFYSVGDPDVMIARIQQLENPLSFLLRRGFGSINSGLLKQVMKDGSSLSGQSWISGFAGAVRNAGRGWNNELVTKESADDLALDLAQGIKTIVLERGFMFYSFMGYMGIRTAPLWLGCWITNNLGITDNVDYKTLESKVDKMYEFAKAKEDLDRREHDLAIALRRKEHNQIAESVAHIGGIATGAVAGTAALVASGGNPVAGQAAFNTTKSLVSKGAEMAMKKPETTRGMVDRQLATKRREALETVLKTGDASAIKDYAEENVRRRKEQFEKEYEHSIYNKDNIEALRTDAVKLGRVGYEAVGEGVEKTRKLFRGRKAEKDIKELEKRIEENPEDKEAQARLQEARQRAQRERSEEEARKRERLKRLEALTGDETLLDEHVKSSNTERYSCTDEGVCVEGDSDYSAELREGALDEGPFFARTVQEARAHCCQPASANERELQSLRAQKKEAETREELARLQAEVAAASKLLDVKKDTFALEEERRVDAARRDLNVAREAENLAKDEECQTLLGTLNKWRSGGISPRQCGERYGEAFWKEHEAKAKERYAFLDRQGIYVPEVIAAQKSGGAVNRLAIQRLKLEGYAEAEPPAKAAAKAGRRRKAGRKDLRRARKAAHRARKAAHRARKAAHRARKATESEACQTGKLSKTSFGRHPETPRPASPRLLRPKNFSRPPILCPKNFSRPPPTRPKNFSRPPPARPPILRPKNFSRPPPARPPILRPKNFSRPFILRPKECPEEEEECPEEEEEECPEKECGRPETAAFQPQAPTTKHVHLQQTRRNRAVRRRYLGAARRPAPAPGGRARETGARRRSGGRRGLREGAPPAPGRRPGVQTRRGARAPRRGGRQPGRLPRRAAVAAVPAAAHRSREDRRHGVGARTHAGQGGKSLPLTNKQKKIMPTKVLAGSPTTGSSAAGR